MSKRQYMEAVEREERIREAAPDLLKALEAANLELSALVPEPSNTQRGDWPEELNGADVECLHRAFVTIRAAIAKAKGLTP